jgi:hypothetical protein
MSLLNFVISSLVSSQFVFLPQSLEKHQLTHIPQNFNKDLIDQYKSLNSQIDKVRDDTKLQLLDNQEASTQIILKKHELYCQVSNLKY